MMRFVLPLRAAAAVLAVGIAGAAVAPSAFADGHRDFHHGYYDRYHHWHPPIVYAAPVDPYAYAPPPVVYAPPPAPYAYAPPPVVYSPPLLGLGLNIRLR